MTPRLYLDLDGVMADFDHGFERLFGMSNREFRQKHGEQADDVMWPVILERPDFFRALPPTHGAKAFLRELHDAGFPQPIILTACPKTSYESAARQKREWVREHLGAHLTVLPVMGGRNKPLFMHDAGDVLIDDHRRNIEVWRAEGGVGILHRSWVDTFEQLFEAYPQLSRRVPA